MAKNKLYRLKSVEKELDADLFAQIFDYYQDNKNNFNAERDPFEILMALKDNTATYILDPSGQIVASSLTFRYGTRHTETGASRVTKNGFAFQRVLKHYQVINDYLFRWPEAHFFATVAKNNAASIHNIEKCGFEQIKITEDFVHDLGLLPENKPFKDKVIYAYNLENIKHSAQELLVLYNTPELTNKSNTESIHFRFETKLLTNEGMLSVVRTLAQG
ncbi:GNAT family protein [Magnetovibrio sp. PR-2]|uniref:GNAT family N-acetyltransferase n=1 Tax=Magnetovibrio sp. PR-2 TaxID=3120356 RepID=UPI002FCE64EA